MEQNKEQLVTIKGTKEGLIFSFAEDSSFQQLLDELQEKLDTAYPQNDEDEYASVIINLGHRYVTAEQKEQLKQLIEKNNQLRVKRYESEVVDKQTAEKWLAESEVTAVSQIVRSGQVLEVEGDLLLIGDVNPGGEVRATGNIYIMGKLHGIAHAGVNGDVEAVIAAAFMNPMQLRIAHYISRAPDYETEGVYMECGYFDKEQDKIVIDRLQVLPYVRKQLRNVERRLHNG